MVNPVGITQDKDGSWKWTLPDGTSATGFKSREAARTDYAKARAKLGTDSAAAAQPAATKAAVVKPAVTATPAKAQKAVKPTPVKAQKAVKATPAKAQKAVKPVVAKKAVASKKAQPLKQRRVPVPKPLVASAPMRTNRADGPVARSRVIFDANPTARRKDVLALCVAAGINPHTAWTQYRKWRKARIASATS